MSKEPKPQLKKQFNVPEGGIDAKTVELPKFKKFAKKSKQKFKKTLSEILAQDPTVNIKQLAKRVRLTRHTVLKYIYELKTEGDFGALERTRIYEEKRGNAQKVQKTILEYWQNFPYSSDVEVAEALSLQLKTVKDHKRALLKKDPGCIKSLRVSMQDANIKLLISDFFKKNPLASQQDASEAIGISRATVKKHCVELTDRINSEAADTYGLVSTWYADQLMNTIEMCDKKFKKCKAPTHGSRWIELRLQALKMLARKFKIEQPDVNVNFNIEATKEERDAVAESLMKTMQFSQGMKLVEPYKPKLPSPDFPDDATEGSCDSDDGIIDIDIGEE